MRGGIGVDVARVGCRLEDAAQRQDAGGRSSPSAMICGTPGSSGSRPCTIATWSWSSKVQVVMNIFGSVCPMTCRSSCVRNCIGSGVTIGAEARTCKVDHDQLDDVRQLHHDDVVLADARLEERVASRSVAVLSSRIGQALGSARRQGRAVGRVDHGDRIRRPPHILEEQVDERSPPHQPLWVYASTRSGVSRIMAPPAPIGAFAPMGME